MVGKDTFDADVRQYVESCISSTFFPHVIPMQEESPEKQYRGPAPGVPAIDSLRRSQWAGVLCKVTMTVRE